MKKTAQEILILLQHIDIGYCPKKREIEYLHSIRELDLSNETQVSAASISALPKTIKLLTALQVLDISNTGIKFLPNELTLIKSLERLDASYSALVCLPDEIGRLENLQYLNLRITKITEMPESMRKLTKLKELILYGTQIKSLGSWVESLKSLQKLDLCYSHIDSLPTGLEHLPELKQVLVNNTSIEEIPRALALGQLPITKNKISFAPGIYADMTRLPNWYFEGKEILARYLSQEERDGFHDAKIIFLGYGNTGKTYTINRFIRNGQKALPDQDYGGDETHGVGIYDYEHETPSNERYMLHLWDFGGQEMLHSMHRCFMTKDTVYVLMVCSRDDHQTQQLQYWLNSIIPYIANQYDHSIPENERWKPTVTIIENRFNDYRSPDVDEALLIRKYGSKLHLKFIPISVKDSDQETFTLQIMTPLIELAIDADKRAAHPPISYVKVRNSIKNDLEEHGFIEKNKYIEYCEDNNVVSTEEQTQLITHFTNLGICLCAEPTLSDREEEGYRLIRPLWLTNALYAIICECEASNGTVSKLNIQRRLTSQSPPEDLGPQYQRFDPSITYEWEDVDYILYLAEKESLVYEAPGDPDSLFIPAMCQYEKRPNHFEKPSNPPYNVQYEVTYPHLPEMTIQQLMVNSMRNFLTLDKCWRGGFFASGRNCKAIVDTDIETSTLKFDLWSSNGLHPIKDLFETFRSLLDLDQNKHPEVEEYIIRGQDRFSVVELLNAEKTEINEIPSKKVFGTKYNVQELLGSYPDNAIHNYREQIILNVFNGPYYDQRSTNDGGEMAVNYAEHGSAIVNNLPNK